MRICLPRCSSSLRASRPRFSSASFWLVVTASTPAEATFTGRVTTSTAVLARVLTTQPPSRAGARMTRTRFIGRKFAEAARTGNEQSEVHGGFGERFGLRQERLIGLGARRQRL